MSKAGSIGGAVLFLLAAAALCKLVLSAKPESVESRNRQLAEIFRQGMREKKKAEIFIDSLLKAQGPVFLYTNDTGAKAGWVPNMEGSGTNGVASMVAEINSYQEFAKKYDSLGFVLLLNSSGKFIYPLNNVFIPADRAGTKHLYFMGYDSKGKIRKDAASLKTSPGIAGQNFVTTWGRGVNNVSKPTIDPLVDFHFLFCFNCLKTVDGFFVYMAGVAKDGRHPGMDSAEFRQLVTLFNKGLRKEGIDTSRFRVKVFTRPK